MRTIEYVVLTLMVCAVVIYGATAIANSISSSLNNDAILIESAGR